MAKVQKIDLGASWGDTAFTKYAKETINIVFKLDKFLTRNYGVRCDEFEAGCVVCEVWAKRDDLQKFICE